METRVKSELKVDDDVFIIGVKYSIFHGKNGTVKALLPTGMIEVHFAKEFSYIFGFEYDQGKTTWEFEPKDVKKFILDEFPHRKANRLYNQNYNVLCSFTYKFSPENDCMCKGCKQKATKRILFNIWGTVGEYDVCQEHAVMDGKCGDMFDVKTGYTAQVKEPIKKK
jgi:hypothetical protein